MHIERIRLTDCGGFEALDLRLSPKLNVLIGGNGAGKSTILQQLRAALALSVHASRTLGNFAFEVRGGAERACVDVWLRGEVDYRLSYRIHREGNLSIDRADERTLPALVWHFLGPNRVNPGVDMHRSPHRDDVGATRLTAFEDFLDWFRVTENQENERRLTDDQNLSYRHPELEAVRHALNGVLSRMPAAGLTGIRFTRVGRRVPLEGTLVVDKGGSTLNLDQLSEGESTMLLLIGDIAHRLAQANPAVDEPLAGEGIVLIDAIELHLHPSWQRALLPALTQTFPNVQFVVTTHSPQVIGEVPRESVICLRDFAVVPTPPTFGRDSNSILEEVMGASSRDETIKRSLAEVAALIDSERFDEARAQINALEATLGPDDPDLVGNRAAIGFLDET